MMTFREKLADPGRRLSVHVCVIPSPVVTQAMAAAGADAVIVDLEHGAVDYGSAHGMIAATAGTDCAALVRVAKIDAAHVKRVMDLGAAGIVYPLVRTAGERARRWPACAIRRSASVAGGRSLRIRMRRWGCWITLRRSDPRRCAAC